MDDSFLIFPISSKSLTIIAVLDTDKAAEINNASINSRPSAVEV